MIQEILIIFVGIFLAFLDSLDIIIFAILFSILRNRNSSQNFAAFMLTYSFLILVQGVLVLVFGKQLLTHLGAFGSQPSGDINLTIGIGLIAYGAYLFFKKKEEIKEEKYSKSSIFGYIGLGILIAIIGIVDSVIYFGYLLEVISIGSSFGFEITALMIYNIFFLLPYIILFRMYKVEGSKAKIRTEKVLKFIFEKKIIEITLILIGLYLIFI